MLFPPPGVKIRRTIETLFLPDVPTLIAGRDSQRVLLSVLLDYNTNVIAAFAGSAAGLSTSVCVYGDQCVPALFWGSEEVWAQWIAGNTTNGGPILVQSVFYD